MTPLLDELLKELKEKLGEDLDLANNHYFLFLEDGVFDVYLDTDEKQIKVNINLSDGIKIAHTNKSLEVLMNES